MPQLSQNTTKTHPRRAGRAARLLALAAAFVLFFRALPQAAFAADISGSVASSVTWSDGDIIVSAVTVTGGTEAAPVVITVNGTVTQQAAVTVSSGYVIFTGGGTLLRGASFTADNMVSVTGANVTFENITLDGNHVECSNYRALNLSGASNITINEGTVICNNVKTTQQGSAIYAGSGAVAITMNGGEIKNNRQTSRGAIYLDNGSNRDSCTFTMNSGSVTENACTNETTGYGGGAFYLRYATLTINGGTISGNSVPLAATNGKGGGIYCSSYGKVVLNGGVIRGNTAYVGSGIFFSSVTNADAELYIGGETLITGGDAIYLDNSGATKYPFVTSKIKNDLPLSVSSASEGLVIAKGSGYTLTDADMAKTIISTSDGIQWYAKLDATDNQIILAQTQPQPPAAYYHVSYYGNGGTGSVTDDTDYTSGQQVTAMANGFSRAGYGFTGYNTAADGSGSAYQPSDTFSITADTPLFAQWRAGQYPVAYSLTGLTASGAATATHGEAYTATLIASAHYSLPATAEVKVGSATLVAGTDYTCSAGVITINADKVTGGIAITASGVPESYTVSYTGMEAATPGTNYPSSHTYGTVSPVSDPAKTGYTFEGWIVNGAGAATKDLTLAAGAYTASISLKATWAAESYPIGYTLNGGSVSPDNPARYTAETDSFTLKNPTKTGYAFQGWSGTDLTGDSNTSVSIPKGSTGNREYTANWTANTYAVIYGGNGATSGATPQSTHTYDVAQDLAENGFARSYTVSFSGNGAGDPSPLSADYSFRGWNTSSDATGDSYTDKQSVTNLATNGSVNLYALWASAPVTLPTISRTGYAFAGWYTQASGGARVGGAGDSYTPAAPAALYAQWTADTHALTLDKNGGDAGGAATATYDSAALTALAHAARAGYRLDGYFTQTSGGDLVISASGALAANVSGYTDAAGRWIRDSAAALYAQWTLCTFSISADPAAKDFGSDIEGYAAAPAAQTFTVTNNGNQSVTLAQPSAADYIVSAPSPATVAPNGGTATFTVQPRTRLPAGAHSAEIEILTTPAQTAPVTVSVSFQVEASMPVSISHPSFIYKQAPIDETITVGHGIAAIDAAGFAYLTVDGGAQMGASSPNILSVEDGSVRITFAQSYLNTLSVGVHPVRVTLGGAYAGTYPTSITVRPVGGDSGRANPDTGIRRGAAPPRAPDTENVPK